MRCTACAPAYTILVNQGNGNEEVGFQRSSVSTSYHIFCKATLKSEAGTRLSPKFNTDDSVEYNCHLTIFAVIHWHL